jgi:flagellar protein FlgJ
MREALMQTQPQQNVAEILSQGLPEMMPDLGGATSAASRQRQIADMLLQGAQSQDNTSIAGGLSQLGQAFLARKAGQKADTAEDKQREMASLLMQQAMQGGEQGQASLQQLLTQNPNAAMQYAIQANAPKPPPEAYTLGEGQRRYVGDQMIAEVPKPTEAPKYEKVSLADGEYEYIPGQPESLRKVGDSPVKPPLVDIRLPGEGPQETAFMKKAGELEAGNFGSLVEMGQTARRNRVTLDQLDVAAAGIPGGLEATAKAALGNMGIETQGLSEIQATEALINQLVPAQRAPGSGPMSDRDLALFKQSLPRLIQSADGRAKILTNMKAINDYVVREGQIANRVLSGEITPPEGRRQIEGLGNPLANKDANGLPPGFIVIE